MYDWQVAIASSSVNHFVLLLPLLILPGHLALFCSPRLQQCCMHHFLSAADFATKQMPKLKAITLSGQIQYVHLKAMVVCDKTSY